MDTPLDRGLSGATPTVKPGPVFETPVLFREKQIFKKTISKKKSGHLSDWT